MAVVARTSSAMEGELGKEHSVGMLQGTGLQKQTSSTIPKRVTWNETGGELWHLRCLIKFRQK